jgi:hypothetical protein
MSVQVKKGLFSIATDTVVIRGSFRRQPEIRVETGKEPSSN